MAILHVYPLAPSLGLPAGLRYCQLIETELEAEFPAQVARMGTMYRRDEARRMQAVSACYLGREFSSSEGPPRSALNRSVSNSTGDSPLTTLHVHQVSSSARF